MGNVSVVLGAQWGDEGKGKLVDILAPKFDIVGRATGGANAGHTVVVGDKKFVFHLLPSGLLNEKTSCMIGNGVVVHLKTMFDELSKLDSGGIEWRSRLKLSDRATILFDFHKIIDGLQEDSKGESKVGTTRRGIGPCYSEKISRHAIRMCDLRDLDAFKRKYSEAVARFKNDFNLPYSEEESELAWHLEMAVQIVSMLSPVAEVILDEIKSGKSVLVEGANGFMLDIDHGTYPFVTSSNSSIGGICTGLGLPPSVIGSVIGIVKAYSTRVGAGPFISELTDSIGDLIRTKGGEFGSTTGRPRRCGWLDLFQLKYAVKLNGISEINLTKLDVLTGIGEVKVCVGYKIDGRLLEYYPSRIEELERCEPIYKVFQGWDDDLSRFKSFDELPLNAKMYIDFIQSEIGVKISSIGVGPARDQMLFC